MSASEIEAIKAKFKKADKNGDGLISLDELRDTFQGLGTWTDEEFKVLFEQADTNGDGKLQYEEFVQWLLTDECPAAVKAADASALLKGIFEGMDGDGSGKIDVSELNKALKNSIELQALFNVKYNTSSKGAGKGSAPPLPSFFTEQIAKLDLDGDGQVSFEEFESHFFPKLDGQTGSIESWATLWRVFNSSDADNNGKIDSKELNKSLRESVEIQELFNFEYYKDSGKGKGKGVAPPLPKVFEDLVAKLDTNGDGMISWPEFSEYMQAKK